MKPLRILVAAVASAVVSQPALADKTDVAHLVNGDAITGEIKSLDFGSLSYSTDSMGTVSIDWEDVTGLTSKQTLQVEVTDGNRYFGHLDATEKEYQIRVVTLSEPVELPMNQVVRMTPIDTDDPFLERLDGSFSLGFTTQKSSEVTTLNVATDISYRARQFALGLQANATYTEQPSEPRTDRANVGLNYQRFRGNRWYTEWYGSWETNDEIGVESRYTLGGGLGRYLVQSNRNQFSLAVGINGTNERDTDSDSATTDAEGRIQMRYLHRRIDPKANATVTTNVYPKLNDLSDYRAETDISFSRELIDDLYLDFTVYHSYTTDPPAGASSTDYGATTSLGYSW